MGKVALHFISGQEGLITILIYLPFTQEIVPKRQAVGPQHFSKIAPTFDLSFIFIGYTEARVKNNDLTGKCGGVTDVYRAYIRP